MLDDILTNAWWFVLLLCSIYIGLRGMSRLVDKGYRWQVQTGKKPTPPWKEPVKLECKECGTTEVHFWHRDRVGTSCMKCWSKGVGDDGS